VFLVLWSLIVGCYALQIALTTNLTSFIGKLGKLFKLSSSEFLVRYSVGRGKVPDQFVLEADTWRDVLSNKTNGNVRGAIAACARLTCLHALAQVLRASDRGEAKSWQSGSANSAQLAQTNGCPHGS
jgi:hypothetical protein